MLALFLSLAFLAAPATATSATATPAAATSALGGDDTPKKPTSGSEEQKDKCITFPIVGEICFPR